MVMNSEENAGVRETLTQVLTAVSSEFQRRRKKYPRKNVAVNSPS